LLYLTISGLLIILGLLGNNILAENRRLHTENEALRKLFTQAVFKAEELAEKLEYANRWLRAKD
jgi:hypothetical protein